MSILEISETTNEGEHRWGVSLIDNEDVAILRSVTPQVKGATLSMAKVLKHKGPDAPLLHEGSEDPNSPAWIVEKADDGWFVRFTLVSETSFEVLSKLEKSVSPADIDEKAFELVRGNLAKAEIKWNPPEADPAYIEKQSDLTPTTGIPGS